MKIHPHKNTLLQVAQGNALTKTCKRVFLFSTQEKLKNKKFSPLQKNKTSQPHDLRQSSILTGYFLTQADIATGQGRRRASANSGFKKLAVQWLSKHLCFVSSVVLADSFVLRNRQLLKPAKRYGQVKKTDNTV